MKTMAIMTGLLALAVTAGCASAPMRTPQELESGATGIELRGGGEFRVATPAADSGWLGFRTLNTGSQPVAELRFWTSADGGLMRDLGGGPEGPWIPFALLPNERFICTVGAPRGMMDRRLLSAALWEKPETSAQFAGSVRNARNVRFDADRGIELLGPEAGFDLVFAAPFPQEKARVAWQCSQMFSQSSGPDRERDVTGRIQVWLSLDNSGWARLPMPTGGVSWMQALDFSALIENARYFALRFTVAPAGNSGTGPEVGSEAAIGERPVTPIRMTHLRVEREMEAWGSMDHWRREGGVCNLGWREAAESRLLLTFVPEDQPAATSGERPDAGGY